MDLVFERKDIMHLNTAGTCSGRKKDSSEEGFGYFTLLVGDRYSFKKLMSNDDYLVGSEPQVARPREARVACCIGSSCSFSEVPTKIFRVSCHVKRFRVLVKRFRVSSDDVRTTPEVSTSLICQSGTCLATTQKRCPLVIFKTKYVLGPY